MPRTLFCVVLGILMVAASCEPVLAVTRFSATGITVRQKWIVDKTDMSLAKAPASHFIDNENAFAELWKAWRKDDLPKVDFSKEIVLVLTAHENAVVDIKAVLSDKGVLDFTLTSTERRSHGMTYVIAIVERNGIKAVGNTPVPPLK